MLSILILTHNEERNISGCLDSVGWSDDIVILDSFSTDQTAAIAERNRVRFSQRRFDGYASQRNAALELGFKHPWVLMLDADERVPSDLKMEMFQAVADSDTATAMFRMRRKDFFMGRWLKASSGYPTWFGRLVRVGRVWVEREINEEYHTDGRIGILDSHLHHYPFSKGLASWVEKHNRYSTMEAEALPCTHKSYSDLKQIFSRDPMARRKAAKALAYRMPLRPLLVLGYLLVVRRGILDGKPGLHFAMLRAFYEYLIDLKQKEIQSKEAGLPF